MFLGRLRLCYSPKVQLGDPLSETVCTVHFLYSLAMSNASYLLARVINHTFVQIRKIATSNHVIVPHYLGTENIYMDTYQKRKGRKKKKVTTFLRLSPHLRLYGIIWISPFYLIY